jgi:hypothetical protein
MAEDPDVEYLYRHEVPKLVDWLMVQIMHAMPAEVIPFLTDLMAPKEWFNVHGDRTTLYGPAPCLESSTLPLMFCGDFEQLTPDHEVLAKAVASAAGKAPKKQVHVFFETSALDKGRAPLDEQGLQQRAKPFRGKFDLMLTYTTTFEEKAKLFPHHIFVVPYTVAARLVAPDQQAQLRTVRSVGCSFMVMSHEVDGKVKGVGDLPRPEGLSEEEFAQLFIDSLRMDHRLVPSMTGVQMAAFR